MKKLPVKIIVTALIPLKINVNKEDLIQNWQLNRRFEPTMGADERAKLYAGWQKAVKRSMYWEE